MVASDAAFTRFFGDEAKSMRERGENFKASKKVLSFTYDKKLHHLQGTVACSKRKGSRTVWVEFSASGEILKASCPCARGVRCAHMAALLVAKQEVSCTEVACRWSIKKTPEDDTVVTVNSIYKGKKFTPSHGPINREVFQKLFEDLAECPGDSGAGVRFLLRPCPIPPPAPPSNLVDVPDALEVIRDPEFTPDDPRWFIEERLVLSRSEIVELAGLTKDQASNPEWARVRRGRITARKFGQVLGAMKRNREPPKSLLQGLLFYRNLDGVKAIEWGKTHEKVAIRDFSKMTGLQVEKTGIWLEHTGVLGASPDGLIGEDEIIEVKCPYSIRNAHPDTALRDPKNKKKWCLFFEDGVWNVDKEHCFYHQIQGSLYFCNRNLAQFCIWTLQGLRYVAIEKDPLWERNIALLKDFYYDIYVPFLRGQGPPAA